MGDKLRLRQIALVADTLAPAEESLAAVFGLEVCYRDPAVAVFGLENCLFPVGNQFLEIVAPTRSGTHAGRFLERRHGPGGYMVITQCDDHDARRERVEALGVRIAHQFEIDAFINMQLHPRDTGGSFFEIDQQFGDDAEKDDGPWAPAGSDWKKHVRTERVDAILAAEIQCDSPLETARRWAEIAERPVFEADAAQCIDLDNARLRFVPCRDGRPEGLAGVDLSASDADAVRAAAENAGAVFGDDGFVLAGMRWRLR